MEEAQEARKSKQTNQPFHLRASWLQKSPVLWGIFFSAVWREESYLLFYLSHCAVETSNKKILWAQRTTQYESQPSVMSRVKLIILEDIQSCCCYSKGWVDKDSIHIFLSFRKLCGREVGQRAWRRKYKLSIETRNNTCNGQTGLEESGCFLFCRSWLLCRGVLQVILNASRHCMRQADLRSNWQMG